MNINTEVKLLNTMMRHYLAQVDFYWPRSSDYTDLYIFYDMSGKLNHSYALCLERTLIPRTLERAARLIMEVKTLSMTTDYLDKEFFTLRSQLRQAAYYFTRAREGKAK